MQQVGPEAPPQRGSPRVIWAALAVALAVLFGVSELREKPSVVQSDAIVRIDLDGLRYSFQPVTGDEALFDLERDPDCLVNVAPTRIDDMVRLRRRLLDELGVPDLATLREPHAEAIERLRSLGYL